MIKINLDKAKNIVKDQIRLKRKNFFEQLDIEYIRAIENNDIEKQQKIAHTKKLLRDCTSDPRIENASNIDFLKEVDPVSEIFLDYYSV